MSVFQALKDFFDSVFRSYSPEVQKKLRLKKIEITLKENPSGIYKNGLVQPNFAEALRVLYLNTKPVNNVLENTICGNDIPRNKRFEGQLVITGYSKESQELLQSLTYEERKKEVLGSSQSNSRVFEDQRRRLERLVHELNTKEFIKLDVVMVKLKQLNDLCNFNFVTPLQSFDNHYNPLELDSVPNFQALPLAVLENVFEDLYYVLEHFDITMSVANAIIALAQLIAPDVLTQDKRNSLLQNLKKIEGVTSHVLTAEVLKNFTILTKNDPDYTPKIANYKATARQDFSQFLQEQVTSEENRIKREIKDETIQSELRELFADKNLVDLNGYNTALSNEIQKNSSVSFIWITPLKVLKNFLQSFFPDELKSLLNNIVIEGFFNNPSYKSQFSSSVYLACESLNRIQAFEASFARGGEFDEALIGSYIKDSHKDGDFLKKLTSTVDTINVEAKSIIQREVSALNSLYVEMGDLLQDAKKPACEIVSNLKVLMMSSRNRDSTDSFEKQYPLWHIFFEIMKNYAIINVAE